VSVIYKLEPFSILIQIEFIRLKTISLKIYDFKIFKNQYHYSRLY